MSVEPPVTPHPPTRALFGPFELRLAQRLLLRDGRPVKLGSRAFELLAALARSAGAVISHEELVRSAWPDTVVVEQNLRVQLWTLRRALSEGPDARWILNISGRGYCFVGKVAWQAG